MTRMTRPLGTALCLGLVGLYKDFLEGCLSVERRQLEPSPATDTLGFFKIEGYTSPTLEVKGKITKPSPNFEWGGYKLHKANGFKIHCLRCSGMPRSAQAAVTNTTE